MPKMASHFKRLCAPKPRVARMRKAAPSFFQKIPEGDYRVEPSSTTTRSLWQISAGRDPQSVLSSPVAIGELRVDPKTSILPGLLACRTFYPPLVLVTAFSPFFSHPSHRSYAATSSHFLFPAAAICVSTRWAQNIGGRFPDHLAFYGCRFILPSPSFPFRICFCTVSYSRLDAGRPRDFTIAVQIFETTAPRKGRCSHPRPGVDILYPSPGVFRDPDADCRGRVSFWFWYGK